MEKERTKKDQETKVRTLYEESRQWHSRLYFLQDEIKFINHLLNSYTLEPNTPELFEQFQNFKDPLHATKKKLINLQMTIEKHEGSMGGIMESSDEDCDLYFYQTHDQLRIKVESCMHDFEHLKAEIFDYAGGILKKRKSK